MKQTKRVDATDLVDQYTDLTGFEIESTMCDSGVRAALTITGFFATAQEANEWESSFKKFIVESRGEPSSEVTR